MDIHINHRINYSLIFVLVLFCLIYAAISLVNHYNFQTFAWDLGIKNNEIYDYVHFRWNHNFLIIPPIENKLGDHFSLPPLYFAPFLHIFGTYNLLIFQILAILFGGTGIYRIGKMQTGSHSTALLISIYFFSLWGIYFALGFDYHDNVVGAMFLPWFVYYLLRKKWFPVVLFFVLVITGKENLAFWMFFVSLGLFIRFFRHDKMYRIILPILSFFALLYFVVILNYVMPALSGPNYDYFHFQYDVLGDSIAEAFSTMITKPFYALKMLFMNHHGNPVYDNIKTEFLLVLILSGGWLLFYRPVYLLMVLPLIFQKLYHDLPSKWGISAHYSIEFAPVLALVLIEWMQDNRIRKKIRTISLPVILLMTITISLLKIDKQAYPYYDADRVKFYSSEHYRCDYNRKELRKGIRSIPDQQSLIAHSPLVSHLAFRDTVFTFPYGIEKARYILLLPARANRWPSDYREYDYYLALCKSSAYCTTRYGSEEIHVFERIMEIPPILRYDSAQLVQDKLLEIRFDQPLPVDEKAGHLFISGSTDTLPAGGSTYFGIFYPPDPEGYYKITAEISKDVDAGMIISGNEGMRYWNSNSVLVKDTLKAPLLDHQFLVPPGYNGKGVHVHIENRSTIGIAVHSLCFYNLSFPEPKTGNK